MLLKALLDFNDRLSDIILDDKYTLSLLLYRFLQRIRDKIRQSDKNTNDQDNDDSNDQVIFPSGSSSCFDRTLDILEFSVIRFLSDDRRNAGHIDGFFWSIRIDIYDTVRAVRIDHQCIKLRNHLTDRLITQFRIFLHSFLDNSIQALRYSGHKIGCIRNRLLKMLHCNRDRILTVKRNSSGHHLKKSDAERINI